MVLGPLPRLLVLARPLRCRVDDKEARKCAPLGCRRLGRAQERAHAALLQAAHCARVLWRRRFTAGLLSALRAFAPAAALAQRTVRTFSTGCCAFSGGTEGPSRRLLQRAARDATRPDARLAPRAVLSEFACGLRRGLLRQWCCAAARAALRCALLCLSCSPAPRASCKGVWARANGAEATALQLPRLPLPLFI